jgi:glycosyltransferase involved in cell wall biosynthesis
VTTQPPVIRPRIALLPWGLLFDEDYLDTIGVPLHEFCTDAAGGHMFNFIDALRARGIETVLILFSRRVNRPTRFVNGATGATVLVIPPPWLYGGLRNVLRRPLVRRVLRLPGRWFRELVGEAASYLATPVTMLARELRREGCCIIVCQEYEFVRFDVCVLLARAMRMPVFASFQGGNQLRGSLQKLSRPWALRHCDGVIIAPSTEIARVQTAYDVPPSKIAQIFNAVERSAFDSEPRSDARAALKLPSEARVAVWHGRIERHTKGLDVLIDAWEIVCNARPREDLRLVLIGAGNDSAWLHERLDRPGVRGIHWRDEFVSNRAVLRRYLSAADMFAFPSRHEGFAVAPLEAMACGLPVVAADAPGIPDLLPEGEDSCGIVVPRGDADLFAAALGQLLDNPALAREMGVRARARVGACCSLEHVGQQLDTFLTGTSGRRDRRDRRVARPAPPLSAAHSARSS